MQEAMKWSCLGEVPYCTHHEISGANTSFSWVMECKWFHAKCVPECAWYLLVVFSETMGDRTDSEHAQIVYIRPTAIYSKG